MALRSSGQSSCAPGLRRDRQGLCGSIKIPHRLACSDGPCASSRAHEEVAVSHARAGAIAGSSSRRVCVSIASPRRALARCRATEGPADATTSGGGDDELTERATGAMLGAMVGNVLGAPVWGDRHWQVTRRFPSGLTDFWRFDIGDEPVPFGHYTGDFSLLLATARSLVAAGGCNSAHIAAEFIALDLADPAELAAEAKFEEILERLRADAAAAAAAAPKVAAAAAKANAKAPAKGGDGKASSSGKASPGAAAPAGGTAAAAAAAAPAAGAAPEAGAASGGGAESSSAAAASAAQRGAARGRQEEHPELAEFVLPVQRRYPPYAKLFLAALAADGAPLPFIPYLAEKYLAAFTPRFSHISGDRMEREPYGPDDAGGAARVLPVALAYRDAPPSILSAAVNEALIFSHPPGSIGADAARVAAAAIVHLTRTAPPGPAPEAATPRSEGALPSGAAELLDVLDAVAETEEMRRKLKAVRAQAFQIGHVSSWRTFLASPAWARIAAGLSSMTFHGFATPGPEGVAVALWALITSWGRPEQAVCVAATMGGSAPETSQLTGALAGALHGTAWLPQRWSSSLENGHGGRDEVAALGTELASLRCFDALGGPLPREMLEAVGACA
ncbi:hypothetical protein FOA52_013621 [Chlamydomonas sp. UWO 241]|nr:hypothetical protein FOA52_013621 [Chlamydomonas sp. UWO 241]